MVLEPKQTTVAYRCPHCGAGVMSVVGLFNLHSHMVKLKCSCGESEMTMVHGKDGKVRFTVPCILCPNPHNFSISSSLFFGKDLFLGIQNNKKINGNKNLHYLTQFKFSRLALLKVNKKTKQQTKRKHL